MRNPQKLKFRGREAAGTLIDFTLTDITGGKDDYIVIKGGYAILLDTVERWTGLYDKNNNLIFEGDVIELDGFFGASEPSEKFSVEYDEEIASFVYVDEPRQKSRTRFGLSLVERNFMVFGNIYENPELLK